MNSTETFWAKFTVLYTTTLNKEQKIVYNGRYIGYRPVPIRFCIPKVGWAKNQENVEISKNVDVSVKYACKSRMSGLEIQQKIDLVLTCLTYNLLIHIHSCFDPTVQISSAFLKASNSYIFYL